MGNLCSISISTEDTVSRCWDCIVGQACYSCKHERNLKALAVELGKLKARRDDVNQRINLAEQRRMRRLNEVQVWLSRVQIVVEEAEDLIKDGPQEIQKLCLAGCFSKNCKSSYKFGKQVARKLEEIAEVKNEGVFEKVAENQPAARVDVRPTELTVGLETTFVKVWSLLKSNIAGVIGLYGLGGVGKTTLLTQINNELGNQPNGFEVVIWVVVSKNYSFEKVQDKIGEKVGLSNDELWKNKSLDEKAIDIFRVLSETKFIIMLDDVWERVDFIKMGIPLPTRENGCKLVFTTRFLEVCGEMEAREKIKVECLSKEEAWKLFAEKVGEGTLDSHPDIRQLAKQVAATCGGLPLALITIGRAMACKKKPQDWKYAIEVLKEFPHKLARMDQEVYSLLKFSYDSLPNDQVRSCLLYCSLYPEDYRIEKSGLVDIWFCEGFLDEFDNINRARMQGYNIIDSLVNACLLESSQYEEEEEHVMMHDVIRDMALWIAHDCEAPEKKFFVRAGFQLIQAPDVERWQGVRRCSLMDNEIHHLRGTPRCPNLQTLSLKKNDLRKISQGFFQFMHDLKVLDLSSNWNLGELPESISELVSLEYLDLSATRITELPIKPNSLVKLKFLNLWGSHYLKRIPQQLISSFSQLQVFRLSLSSSNDYPEEDNVLKGGNEGLIVELNCLQHLNEVRVEILHGFALQRFLSSHNLLGYSEELWVRNLSESKELIVLPLANMDRLERLYVWSCKSIEEVTTMRGMEWKFNLWHTKPPCFYSLSHVVIDECDKLRDMTWLILAPNLLSLSVNRCPEMEEIINEGKLSEIANVVEIPKSSLFAKLDKLDLRDLPKLKSIYGVALPFPCLTEMFVSQCSKLKKLPLKSACVMGNKIRIVGTKEWWEEVEWENEATRNAFLPSFKPIH